METSLIRAYTFWYCCILDSRIIISSSQTFLVRENTLQLCSLEGSGHALTMLKYLLPSPLIGSLQGELEETEEEEEQLGREPSKSSYGRGSQAKIRRKGTINHVRGSVHSNRSLRGALTPRQKSQDVPEASASMQEPAPMREGGQEQLEMVTVH